jgi:hypothetical protein
MDNSITNNRYTSDQEGTFTCPFCETRYKVTDFRNAISLREAGISCLCQKCQDSVFGKD